MREGPSRQLPRSDGRWDGAEGSWNEACPVSLGRLVVKESRVQPAFSAPHPSAGSPYPGPLAGPATLNRRPAHESRFGVSERRRLAPHAPRPTPLASHARLRAQREPASFLRIPRVPGLIQMDHSRAPRGDCRGDDRVEASADPRWERSEETAAHPVDGRIRRECHLARVIHEAPAATADPAMLTGVLGARTLRRIVPVRLGSSPLRMPVITAVSTARLSSPKSVSRRTFVNDPG